MKKLGKYLVNIITNFHKRFLKHVEQYSFDFEKKFVSRKIRSAENSFGGKKFPPNKFSAKQIFGQKNLCPYIWYRRDVE